MTTNNLENLKDKVISFGQFKEWECKKSRHVFIESEELVWICKNCGEIDHNL